MADENLEKKHNILKESHRHVQFSQTDENFLFSSLTDRFLFCEKRKKLLGNEFHFQLLRGKYVAGWLVRERGEL